MQSGKHYWRSASMINFPSGATDVAGFFFILLRDPAAGSRTTGQQDSRTAGQQDSRPSRVRSGNRKTFILFGSGICFHFILVRVLPTLILISFPFFPLRGIYTYHFSTYDYCEVNDVLKLLYMLGFSCQRPPMRWRRTQC